MEKINDLGRIYRGILGQFCLGEVLGSPFEFQEHLTPPPYEIWLDKIENSADPEWKQPLTDKASQKVVGRTGDDVYFTLALAKSLIEKEDFDPVYTDLKFQEAVKDNNMWGLGGASYHWYQNRLQGIPIEQSAAPVGMAGGAPVMRYSPVPLRHPKDTNWIINTSIAQSKVTHQDDRCAFFAAAASLTLCYLLENKEKSLSAIIAYIIKHLRSYSPNLLSFLEIFLENGTDWDKQYHWLSRLGIEDSTKHFKYLEDRLKRNPHIHPFFGGYVPVTFLWPLCLVLKHEGKFLPAVYECILMKGDTDTTCAVLGSLSGAWEIPNGQIMKWVEKIDKAKEILYIADTLASLQK